MVKLLLNDGNIATGNRYPVGEARSSCTSELLVPFFRQKGFSFKGSP